MRNSAPSGTPTAKYGAFDQIELEPYARAGIPAQSRAR
jgi:hypothetical protein